MKRKATSVVKEKQAFNRKKNKEISKDACNKNLKKKKSMRLQP
jgi:hypothetical protein